MKLTLSFIFLLITFSLFAQIIPTQNGLKLEEHIDRKNIPELIGFHPESDKNFPSDWKLNLANKRIEIGHYLFGYEIEWRKETNDTVYFRGFCFDLNADFAYAHEQRYKNDTLTSQGGLVFENGHLKYIRQAYPLKNTLTRNEFGYWDYEVNYYEYEIFVEGKLSSIYRAEHLNHFYMLTDPVNRNRVNLVYGEDVLDIYK